MRSNLTPPNPLFKKEGELVDFERNAMRLFLEIGVNYLGFKKVGQVYRFEGVGSIGFFKNPTLALPLAGEGISFLPHSF